MEGSSRTFSAVIEWAWITQMNHISYDVSMKYDALQRSQNKRCEQL